MNVVEIIFSPTGGTWKVVNMIDRNWGENMTQIDLSNAKTDFTKCEIKQEDMVLVAMPSFGGRAPAVAIERFRQIKGNGARCTIVCVYGNRAYEDTLVEMEDAAKECGFHVVAAISAVAEHSIMPHYAAGRPNESDRMQLEKFAKQILEKTDAVKNIPGNRPYKKAGGAGLVPKPAKNCVRCGLCVKNCPVQAIDPASFKADSKKCIACMRCVKECPENVRKANCIMVAAASLLLKKACTVAKKNELFL